MPEMIPQESDRQGTEPCFSLYHSCGRGANREDKDGVGGSEADLWEKREDKGKEQRKHKFVAIKHEKMNLKTKEPGRTSGT